MSTPAVVSDPCKWARHDQCDGFAVSPEGAGVCACPRHQHMTAPCAGGAGVWMGQGPQLTVFVRVEGYPEQAVGTVDDLAEIPALFRAVADQTDQLVARQYAERAADLAALGAADDAAASGSSWRQWCAEHGYRCPCCGRLFPDLPAGHRLDVDETGQTATCRSPGSGFVRTVEIAGPHLPMIAALVTRQIAEGT